MWDREPKENWKKSGRKLEENQTKPNKWDREPKENWKKSGRQLEEKENWKKTGKQVKQNPNKTRKEVRIDQDIKCSIDGWDRGEEKGREDK